MAHSRLDTLLLPTLALLFGLFAVLASADNDTYEERCPYDNDVQEIVYSPFKPYFRAFPGEDVQICWLWASCTLTLADPSRQQQFGATALVMGLIAPIFKDIAWPGRRIVLMSERLPFFAEVAVRALGLDPRLPDPQDESGMELEKVRAWWDSSSLALHGRKRPMLWAVAMCLPLLLAGGGLAVVETYSKRASLGCVYPIFILTWFILALLPAGVHAICSKIRMRSHRRKLRRMSDRFKEGRLSPREISAVQGGDEIWLVQLFWAVYYIAGTLVYTSIMAVTVVELAAWVGLSAAFTASCKMLAFFICLLLEKRSQNGSLKQPLAQQPLFHAPNKASAAQDTQ